MSTEQRELAEQVSHHQAEIIRAVRELRGSARLVGSAVRNARPALPAVAWTLGTVVAAGLLLRLRRGGASKLLIVGGLAVDLARLWQLSRTRTPPGSRRLPAPPERRRVSTYR